MRSGCALRAPAGNRGEGAVRPRILSPAPTVEIRLAAPGQLFEMGPLRGLVDTGADACVIPIRLVEPLGLQIDSEQYLTSFGGARHRVDVYIVDVGIGGLRLPGIEVAADADGDDVIVGRNALNKLTLILDGPREVVEIPE